MAQGEPARALIAFSSGGRIFTIEADGSNRTRLTGGPQPRPSETPDYSPAWSPDGTRLAFVRVLELPDEDYRTRIYLMEADGTGREVLAGSGRLAYLADPDWSPGGRRLAYTRFALVDDRLVTSIVVVRADGSHKRTIVRAQIDFRRGFAVVMEPAWSPGGARIAYTKTTLNTDTFNVEQSLHLVRPDGTGRRLLRRDAASAAWSPGGRRIAFASAGDRNRAGLYVMRADGTHLVRLTHSGGNDLFPDWSADGKHLVFASDRNFPRSYQSLELYSIEPDGSCLTWLTNGFPASFTPDWQPDPLAATAPSGCGAVPRRPLVEVRGREARRVDHFKPLWLGKRYRSMLLTNVSAREGGARFSYTDCGRFDPRDCGPSVYLSERWSCSGSSIGFRRPLRLRKRRGALVSVPGRFGGLAVNSGAARVEIDLAGADQRGLHQKMGVVEALRHLRESSPAGRLARAHLPRRVLRQLRRLGLYDRLRRLGRVKAIGCPSRPDRRRPGLPIPIPQPPPATHKIAGVPPLHKIAGVPPLRKIPGAAPWIARNGGYLGRMRNDG